ncbi:MAG TPA: c-type cytochrome [Vicinamibacterales bacterium]|nr:c-type cytochrome [Vicinamibacterales bacterium]
MTTLFIALVLWLQADAPKKGGNPEAAKIANPVAATPASIAAGKRVYQRLCTKCHGPEGKGDGEAATGAQPSDLTAASLQYGSSDGEMFSVLRHGTSRDMESYAERISETDTWNVINYVKSLRK